MNKDTAKIMEELMLCDDFKKFYESNSDQMITESLSAMLARLLESKGASKAQVIKNSELSEVYGYQIFSGARVPEKNKLIQLAVGMSLSVYETQTLLKCAGYPQLYAKLPADAVVLYGIYHGLSVMEINNMLFDCGLETL